MLVPATASSQSSFVAALTASNPSEGIAKESASEFIKFFLDIIDFLSSEGDVGTKWWESCQEVEVEKRWNKISPLLFQIAEEAFPVESMKNSFGTTQFSFSIKTEEFGDIVISDMEETGVAAACIITQSKFIYESGICISIGGKQYYRFNTNVLNLLASLRKHIIENPARYPTPFGENGQGDWCYALGPEQRLCLTY